VNTEQERRYALVADLKRQLVAAEEALRRAFPVLTRNRWIEARRLATRYGLPLDQVRRVVEAAADALPAHERGRYWPAFHHLRRALEAASEQYVEAAYRCGAKR
jgi:hypothetical protein